MKHMKHIYTIYTPIPYTQKKKKEKRKKKKNTHTHNTHLMGVTSTNKAYKLNCMTSPSLVLRSRASY